MGANQPETNDILLNAQINYYCMRGIYKPATGKTNINGFYKAVSLNPEKCRTLICGERGSIPIGNQFTNKVSKDSGIHLDVFTGKKLMTMPNDLDIQKWREFFNLEELDKMAKDTGIKRYLTDVVNRLEIQYNNLQIENNISRLENAEVTDGFKWYYFLHMGSHYQPATMADRRIQDFKRALKLMEVGFWKDCQDDIRKECIEGMQKQLKAASVAHAYNSLFNKNK